MLHLAKGRKVSRKVICDAASPERELRQDDDDETMVHTRATHATRARVFLQLAMARIAAIVTEVQPHPGVKSVKSARADREKAFKEKHSRVDFLMQGFFQYYN